jgi:putative phage-type endonuclease
VSDLQRTAEWFNARIGCLTASRMADAMARLKSGAEAAERRKLKIQLLAERLTGIAAPHFVTAAMQHGIDQEPAAKAAYEILTGEMLTDVGFVPHCVIEFFGASPDALVGSAGLVEIKCPTTETHLAWMLEDQVPAQHQPQMLAQMCCTGRTWCDFVSYDPRLPGRLQLFVRRFEPTYQQLEKIEVEAVAFLAEVERMWQQLVTEPLAA